ncbi:MAG: pyridoxal-phosphate dependent enzyme [Planctomycetes bacterium]|nr:pyridoxal-phosphate dependent enzyme [Planctomycetota bacterium]
MLPTVPLSARVTLGEGSTPLLRSRSIGPKAGIPELYFKLETTNPSGSYKDRFGVVAVSDALAQGKRRIIATSSGNTGAALAAYSAVAGIPVEIAIVEHAPPDKCRQMLAYGARLHRIRGFGVTADVDRQILGALQSRAALPGNMLLISAFKFCPVGMCGVKTIAYELAEQLPGGASHVFCCAGGGGLALATALGYAELKAAGRVQRTPAIECVQPVGNATIAGPLARGAAQAEAVRCETRISGLQVPSVIDGQEALTACAASDGTGHLVQDEEVWEVQARLAREEGIFCEPAAATPLAGALRAQAEGKLRAGPVVCVVTGIGFKDLAAIDRMVPPLEPVWELDAWLSGT